MYLFFDTETTGLSRHSDHVVQVAWILADDDGEIVSKACHVIRPEGFLIPLQAAQIHGISTAIARDIGEPLDWVLEQLSEDVGKASVVVAHNLSFDLGILQNDYKNAGLEFPFHGKTQVCTMRLSTTWCRLPKLNGSTGFKYPKLEELHYRLFGEAFDDAHDALADTQACMRCYFELVNQGVIVAPRLPAKVNGNTGNVRPTTTSSIPPEPQRQTCAPISKAAPASSKPPKEPPSLASRLAYLATHHDSDLRILVATNLDCPAEVQMLLTEDDDVRVVAALAANPRCSKEVFAQLAKNVDLDVLVALAGNQFCPSGILSDLYDQLDEHVIGTLVSNPSCPPAVLADICWAWRDPYEVTAHANPSFSEASFQDLLRGKLHEDTDERSFLAERSDCPPDLLRQLAYDTSWVVRKYVARNLATPPDVLLMLSRIENLDSDDIEEIDDETDDSYNETEDVRAAVAANLSCPKNIFATLCSDKSAVVRLAAANNPNCSIAGLKVLAASQFYEYRELAARHKDCTRDLFEVLANDSCPSVRQAVIENNDCPIDIRAPLFMSERSHGQTEQVEEDKDAELYEYESEIGTVKDCFDVFADRLGENTFKDVSHDPLEDRASKGIFERRASVVTPHADAKPPVTHCNSGQDNSKVVVGILNDVRRSQSLAQTLTSDNCAGNTDIVNNIPDRKIVILTIRQWEDGPWLARAYKARDAAVAYLKSVPVPPVYVTTDQIINAALAVSEHLSNALCDAGVEPLDSESGSDRLVITYTLVARMKMVFSNRSSADDTVNK